MSYPKMLRNWYCAIALVILSGCASTPPVEIEWQDDIPNKQYFIDAYNHSPDNQPLQSLSDYLTWIKRFYNGWVVFAQGWLDLTEKVVTHLEVEAPEKASAIEQRMFDLGGKISAEWAQNSDVRVIHSKNLITWWHATDKAIEENSVLSFADQIEADVTALLEKNIVSDDISMARYFAVAKDDDFDEF